MTRQQFSVKIGTIMEDSPIGLDKWMVAIWLIANAKNGISSYELHRAIGVTQKTAWFMLHRIRLAMQDEPRAASSAATSKSTRRSSAARRATCTRPSKRAVMGRGSSHGSARSP